MPTGNFRRPPQLWEQKLAGLVAVNSVGSVSGGGTTEVGADLPPGDGGPAPEPPAIAPTPTAFGTPSTPTLTGGVQSIMVTWDGLNASGDLYPYETAVVEIHLSTSTGFTPSASTLKGELRYPGSYTLTGLSAGTTYYVKLRGRDAQGNYSTASAQASGTTGLTTTSDYGTATIDAGAVSFNARAIGGITTTVGTSAPSSPVTGDIWLDTTGGATVHKRYNGSAWITQAWGSDSLSANCITATQVAAGAITAGAIAADAVTAAKIKADAIDGKTITGATIRTSATAGTATAPRAGLVIDTSGLRGYNSAGSETININASTGAVTISAYQPAGSYLTSTDVGSGGSTTIDGGRILTGTVSATRIDVDNLTVKKLESAGTNNRRVVIGAVGATDTIQFLGTSNTGFNLGVGAVGTNLYLTGTAGTLEVAPDTNFAGSITADNLATEANLVQYNGYRTTTTAADTILRLRSNVTNTAETKFEVDANGDVQSRTNSYGGFSDARLKDNITPARDYLEDLRSVEIVTFNWQGSEQKLLGVTAQQLQPIFPSMVSEEEDGTLSVKYSVFVPMLITAVQELADKVDSLTARIEALEGA